MKNRKTIVGTLFIAVVLVVVCVMSHLGENKSLFKASVNYRIIDGVIYLDEPERSPSQQSMLEFRAEPLETIRVGFVGLGMRGPDAVDRFSRIEGVAINGLCDKYIERAERCQVYLKNAGMPEAKVYSGDEGYKALCESEDIDLVYIATPWQLHVEVELHRHLIN